MKISRRVNRPSAIGVALLGATLALTACTTDAPDNVQTQSAEKITLPDSELGQSVEWVVGQLNSDSEATDADWEGKLSPTLTAEMTTQELVAVINTEVRPGAPFVPTDFSAGEDNAVVQLLNADGKHVRFVLTVDPEDGLITGIHFAPASS